jgi:hypothetical protein
MALKQATGMVPKQGNWFTAMWSYYRPPKRSTFLCLVDRLPEPDYIWGLHLDEGQPLVLDIKHRMFHLAGPYIETYNVVKNPTIRKSELPDLSASALAHVSRTVGEFMKSGKAEAPSISELPTAAAILGDEQLADGWHACQHDGGFHLILLTRAPKT